MKKNSKKPRALPMAIFPFVLVALILVFITGCGNRKNDPDKTSQTENRIKEGVSVCGVDVSLMTKEEAAKILNSKTASMGIPVFLLKCNDKSFRVAADEIELKPDIQKAVDKAYLMGRENSATEKNHLKAKKVKRNVALSYSYNEEKFLTIAKKILADTLSEPIPMNVETGDDCLVVTNAIPGKTIDTRALKKSINMELVDFVSDKSIELKTKEVRVANLTFSEFINTYLRSARDARYSKKDGKPYIEPEIVGIDFSKEEARKILENNKETKKPYKIPATIIIPKVSAQSLRDKYMNTTLASYSTSFAGSSAGRIANIRLASEKINGYVLNSGDEFSYNRVVGPRTEAAGFKMAQVYIGNKVADGIGGGICQVSSALYNAVVMADLKTVSRTNHSIPVSYVPMGRDATVAYDTIDYVFQNNKPYPVGIRASVEGTTLTVSLIGCEKPDYLVDFEVNRVEVIPFATIKENSPELAEGTEKVITLGADGYVLESYRVYKRNGAEFDRKYESKSRYQPTTQKILVGTGKSGQTGKSYNTNEETKPVSGTNASVSGKKKNLPRKKNSKMDVFSGTTNKKRSEKEGKQTTSKQ